MKDKIAIGWDEYDSSILLQAGLASLPCPDLATPRIPRLPREKRHCTVDSLSWERLKDVNTAVQG